MTVVPFRCPRQACKREITLAPSPTLPPVVPNLGQSPGVARVVCAHCRDSFLFNTLTNAPAKCPHCFRASCVGSSGLKWRRAVAYTLAGVVFLAVSVMLAVVAGQKSSVAMAIGAAALFAIALGLILRGGHYCSMRVSTLEGYVPEA